MIWLDSQLVQIFVTFELISWHLSCMFLNLWFCWFKYLFSYASQFHNCHYSSSSSSITQCHKYDKWKYYLCYLLGVANAIELTNLLYAQFAQFVNSKIQQLGKVCEPPNIVQKLGMWFFSWLTIFDVFSIWPSIQFIVCNISCKQAKCCDFLTYNKDHIFKVFNKWLEVNF
jgi:hypothetical protein